MKERSLIMPGWEVRATREGRKTRFMRPMRPQPGPNLRPHVFPSGEPGWISDLAHEYGPRSGHPSPFGAPGDRLWVRETWYCDHIFAGEQRCVGCVECNCTPESRIRKWQKELYYRADVPSGRFCDAGYWSEPGGWRPSSQMPRWASRLLLEVTDVRVQRVQEVSEEEAWAEGIQAWMESLQMDGIYNPDAHLASYPVTAFGRYWISTHAAKGLSWDSNPWAWSVSFRRLG